MHLRNLLTSKLYATYELSFCNCYLPQKKYQDTTPTCSTATPPSHFTSTELEIEDCMSDADSATFDHHVIEDKEQSDETDCDDNLFEDSLESVDPPASLSSSLIYPGARISNAVSMLLISLSLGKDLCNYK